MSDGRGQTRPEVAFVTLGCKVNQAESEAMAAALASRGVAPGAAVIAGVVVVNTCTVTGEADAKVRKAIRRALASSRAPWVVVTGCLAALDANGLAELGERVIVQPDKALVPESAAGLLGRDAGTALSVPAPAPRRARVQVKVQDGCDSFCAYCIVPFARGLPRSVPAAEVTAEVERLNAGGVGEVVLTGINIGRYADGDLRLPDLVRAVSETGVSRIRISSIEPQDVTEGLLEVAGAEVSVVPHFHVPLQSGCDRTLAEMGRRYDTTAYAGVLGRIRRAVPAAAITTDLLVGFPGETDADFAETLAFVEKAGFARLHVFRYSARPGTRAAARTDQVPADVRTKRSEDARALGERLAEAWAARRIGREASVLIERVGHGRAEGTSEDYLRVELAARTGEGLTPGAIVRVRLEGRSGGFVQGRITPSE